MKRQIFFTCCLLFITIGDAVGQWGKVDPAEIEKMMQLPQDDWLNLTLMGTKIGYAHIYMEKSIYEGGGCHSGACRYGDGSQAHWHRIKTHNNANLIRRYGSRPRYFITTSNETGQEKYVEGRIRNGVAYLETSLAGKTTPARYLFQPIRFLKQMISYFPSTTQYSGW